MAAAEIDPAHVAEVLPEFLFCRIQGSGQTVAVLFAQGMEMQAGNAVQRLRIVFQFPRKDRRADPQTRRRVAGVIDGHGPFRVFGVQPKTAFHRLSGSAGRIDHGAETPPLGKGVEHHMIRPVQQIRHIVFTPACGESMYFPPEFLFCQTRFIRRTRTAAPQGAVEGAGQNREGGPLGKALECQHDFCARAALHVVQNCRVGAQQGKIRDKAGGGPAFGLQFRQVFRFKFAHGFSGGRG